MRGLPESKTLEKPDWAESELKVKVTRYNLIIIIIIIKKTQLNNSIIPQKVFIHSKVFQKSLWEWGGGVGDHQCGVFAAVLSHSRDYLRQGEVGWGAVLKTKRLCWGVKTKRINQSGWICSHIWGVNERIPLGSQRKTKTKKRGWCCGGLDAAAGTGVVSTLGGWGGGGSLTARQAADFTVLCAGLVHEGAVEARPHGWGGGGGRGAAHGLIAQRAGGLPTDCACGGQRDITGCYHTVFTGNSKTTTSLKYTSSVWMSSLQKRTRWKGLLR